MADRVRGYVARTCHPEPDEETFLPKHSPRPAATAGRDQLATPAELAAYLGVPVKTLYQWKYRGTGPRVHKVGRHLRYRWQDVDAWLNTQVPYGLTA
jgi:excisionase family DNA binding protein